ncbi:hypothetical protein CH373_08985 [Leptospira perolatii]|uniref:DUF218 domain-containing protein n=1 Tax=Leptospira perolatii TaxID=2023191 RepID=A0A2M9ZNM5_9LEPT|nr:YdcF family protein [Leptospira perolatii]PJZ69628.1 hypothetical protein CH360_10130 [Leptospira perolatii]PJZ73615.1 hypothetical protein CH373_08985 [Leptospira perolatii]
MDTLFFSLSKLGGLILFPLPACLLFLLLVGVFLPKKKGKYLILAPTILLWICSTNSFSQWLIRGLEDEFPPVQMKELPKTDAILVLGGMVDNMALYPNRPELTASADRITDAVLLYKAGKSPRIVFTGGSGYLLFQTRTEAEDANRFLRSFGIPDHALVLESESRNTQENADLTKEIFAKNRWKSAILITSAFHMKRSLMVFENTGIKIHPWPTDYRSKLSLITLDSFIPSTISLENTTIAWKERIGIFVYGLRKRISTFLPLRFRFPWSKD